ncbi:MAG: YfiR/HmsC family protein [Deltaproteobacteria bacterium]|nr:YfiR/HmsC family protein [Deltaproteobacteria bacterium]
MSRSTKALAFLLFSVFVLAGLAAAAQTVPVDQRMKILLRVLTYDRNFLTRADNGKLVVVVLFDPADTASAAEKSEVVAALGALKKLTVNGLTMDVEPVSWSGPASLTDALRKRRTGAIYVCGGLQGVAADVARVARESRVATLSGARDLTEKGLAVAVVLKNGKGQILVNLKTSKDEGMDLDAALLRLAEVIR